jgi:hypothetical protein
MATRRRAAAVAATSADIPSVGKNMATENVDSDGGNGSESSGPREQPPKQAKHDDPAAASVAAPTPSSASGSNDQFNQLMNMIAKISDRLDTQGTAITNLSDGFTSMQRQVTAKFEEITNKAQTEKDLFDAKIAELQASLAASSISVPAAASSSSAAAPPTSSAPASLGRPGRAGGDPPPVAAAARARRPSPPISATIANRPTTRTVIAFGFPRILPRAALQAHFDDIAAAAPDHFRLNSVVFRGNGGKGYSLDFNDASLAAAFIRWTRDNDTDWEGPRDGDEPIKIKFRLISSPEDSARGRRLSPLYEWLSTNLPDSSAYKVDMRVRANTRKGIISVENDMDCWVIAAIPPDGGPLHFDPDSLTFFGFSEAALSSAAATTKATSH